MPLHRLHSHSTPGIFGCMPLHRLRLACGGEPLSPFRSQGLLSHKYSPMFIRPRNHYKHTDPPSRLWWLFAWPSNHYRHHTPINARDSHAMKKLLSWKCHTRHRSTQNTWLHPQVTDTEPTEKSRLSVTNRAMSFPALQLIKWLRWLSNNHPLPS